MVVVPCLGCSWRNARYLPAGRDQAGDRHLKFHDARDNLRPTPSPTTSPDPDACVPHPTAHPPHPAPESAATFATCGSAAHLGAGVGVHVASATRAAPDWMRCHRGHADNRTTPKHSTIGGAPSATKHRY